MRCILSLFWEVVVLIYLQTGNEKDVTMQAGKQRAVLPLIRKFNEHSTRLLDTALYDLHPSPYPSTDLCVQGRPHGQTATIRHRRRSELAQIFARCPAR